MTKVEMAGNPDTDAALGQTFADAYNLAIADIAAGGDMDADLLTAAAAAGASRREPHADELARSEWDGKRWVLRVGADDLEG